MTKYSEKDMDLSYLHLRKLIGILGILLPFICMTGGFIFGKFSVEQSISYYYHTNMRDFFVGLLFLNSMFLITYKGYEKIDNIVSTISGVAALGIAIFPCLSSECCSSTGLFGLSPSISNTLHLTFASIFFILLAVNSIFLFTKTNTEKATTMKIIRNRVYICCGIIIIFSVLSIFILNLCFSDEIMNSYRIVLIFETIMLSAFGISWLVKGETLLKDKV